MAQLESNSSGGMTAGFICVGDFISLYCEDTDGHVFSCNTSSSFNGLHVYHNLDRDQPSEIPDAQVILIQICIQNRYKLDKKCRKLVEKHHRSEVDLSDLEHRQHLEQARSAANAENVDNMAEQKRNQGKKVRYGEIIQLRHVFTGKYIHVNTNQTSQCDKNNMLLSLQSYNSKNAQFRILPRYKVKSEGEYVQIFDQISFESIKSPGHFYHASHGFPSDRDDTKTISELNLGVDQTGFTILKSHSNVADNESFSRGGQFVQLFHKELEAYVVAEGLFDEDVTEDVHLRIREVDQLDARTLRPSSSAVTYWQIVSEKTVLNGDTLTWDQQFRFCHATTRKFLCMRLSEDAKMEVTMTADGNDPNTVFKLHPVLQESPEVKFESYARIEHVITGSWLHAIKDKSYQRKEFADQKDEKSLKALRWDGGELRELTCCSDKRYDDAYTIQKVENKQVASFNFVAGMVPVLQSLIASRQKGKTLPGKETFKICHALKELKEFMIVDGEPCKERQKLLRNLRVIDLLVKILRFPLRGSTDEYNLAKVFSDAYDILHTYMMGSSRKNALYFAKYIEFFQTQMVYKPANIKKSTDKNVDPFDTELGLKVTKILVELMKDNRKIVDRISKDQIDFFVELLRTNQHYCYLELLRVLCVCNNIAITNNQTYIAEKWLLEDTRGIYLTERGQNIDKKPNESYVSTDQMKTWILLADFVQPDECDQEGKDMCKFLVMQLDLFIALCHGRNEQCIRLITKDLSYLTWEEAYLCLSSDHLPFDMRAKYCELVIGLFVNVGNNYSVVENPMLSFIYEYVGTRDINKSANNDSYAAKDLVTIFPVIRDWISSFLDENKYMVATEISRNMLIEQVLRLLSYLVQFGYYGEVDDLQHLLQPLVNLLDGTNDMPCPIDTNRTKDLSKEQKKAIQRFKQQERYVKSPETLAIVNAKYAGLEVLDLVMTFQENARLSSFITKFKECELSEKITVKGKRGRHVLVPALYDSFDSFDDKGAAIKTQNKMKKDLKQMFDDSSRYLDVDKLTSIFIDLAHYESDEMVQLSLKLLNRLFSARATMFQYAISSLVLVTPDSCRVHREVGKQVPLLKMMARSKWTEEQGVKMMQILSEFIGTCHLPKAVEEPHPMNQRLMISHNVLSVLFDILSAETDMISSDSKSAGVLRKAVQLLRALTLRYEDVQNSVFANLDNLLKVRLVEPDLALALKEVFVNNQELCLKILPRQILKLVYLVSENQEKAPEFLELLSAIVKVEGPGLALKRNQTLVMKYIMQNYSKVAYILEQCSADERMHVLLGERGQAHQQYLISLIDLLANCAEGENRYIESLCQTILSIEEILRILNNEDIENHLKKPFLRYMLFAYMKTSASAAENSATDLIHDSLIWEFIVNLTNELCGLAQWIKQESKSVKGKENIYFMSNKLFPKIMRLHDTCTLCSTLVAEDESKPLRLNLENAVVKMREDDMRGHASLHYIFDAVFPFMQIFAQKFFNMDDEEHAHEKERFDQLTIAAIAFCKQLAPILASPEALTQMVSCLSNMVRRTNLPQDIMEPVVENIGKGERLIDTVSQMKAGNKEYYAEEIILNSKLKTLAVNTSLLWGGHNTVQAQLKIKGSREYTVLNDDESLPLGEEFQNHVKCFINQNSRKIEMRYKLAILLINQLRYSAVLMASATSKTCNSREQRYFREQEKVDTRSLQILRAFIHNEERRLPEDWEFRGNEYNVKKGIRTIADIQTTLNNFGCIKHILPHLASTNSNIAKEVLSLLGMMLFNANYRVQENMLNYFLHTKEEVFFYAVRNRLQLSTANIKERRLLISQQKARKLESKSQADNLKTTMTLGVKALQQIKLYKNMMKLEEESHDLTNNGTLMRRVSLTKMQQTQLKSKQGKSDSVVEVEVVEKEKKKSKKTGKQVVFANGIGTNEKDTVALIDNSEMEANIQACSLDPHDSDDTISMKDDGYIALVLKVLARICDGQHLGLQHYLREQPDNIKSFNIVAEVSQFINVAYSNVTGDTIDLVIQLFSSVNEFCAGNQENRATVYDNKIIDYINYILRTSSFENCSMDQIVDLRQSIANLIVSLIEENSAEAIIIATEVKDTLDKEAIYRVMTECYEMLQPQKNLQGKSGGISKLAMFFRKEENKELKDAIYEVGFTFYIVLARLYDLDPTMGKKELRISDIQIKAFKFFKKNSMTIEMLKNDNLQKIHFRVKNKNVIREEIKEKLKWNVDRSSPSNKIRDFMEWSRSILQDIQYQKKVLSNPITIFLTRCWLIWNHMSTITAVILNLIMLIGFKAPENGSITVGNPINASIPLPVAFHDTTAVWKDEYPNLPTWMQIFAYVLNILSIILLLTFFIANHPHPPDVVGWYQRFRKWRQKGAAGTEDDDLRDTSTSDKLGVQLFSVTTFYYFVFVGCSFAGTFYSPYFFAFHLLNIVNNNQLLQGVIQAVTMNGLSLIWVSILGIVVMYLYAVISFAVFRGGFNPENLMFSANLYQTFVTILRFGLIGDLFENLVPPDGHKTFSEYLSMALFHISFFILITTVGLNIIFGIIVDTFSELRNMKWTAEVDMRDTCFICSRNNYDFEHHGQGFESHVANEHNMWAYIFFFIHLQDTKNTDYTSLDLHVHKLLAEGKNDFFPLNRALCLSAKDEDSTDSKIDELLANVKDLVYHQKEEEVERRRWAELTRQKKWQRKVKEGRDQDSSGDDDDDFKLQRAASFRHLARSPSPSHDSEEDYRVTSSRHQSEGPTPSRKSGLVHEEPPPAVEHLDFLDEYDDEGEKKGSH